ncbi:hypothetical protein MSP8887_04388 [Marinomonas spartinae]|uniref:hypothetical protein n=1 Tax=Marinomonas spartinae TaxID=1792290 RepID=UPI000808D3A2|nr:hypothetical protein [Marinomonas spartinae]SBS40443.1 hypothetical protein MSP8887_04388 [Marinomonas spartinae]
MDSFSFSICLKMFPGKEKLPSFSAIDNLNFFFDADVENMISEYILDNAVDLNNIEINEFLKRLKKFNYILTNRLINDAIDYYFSHPAVLSSLQGDRVPLFPNYRSLPEINYDLLIPVIELG